MKKLVSKALSLTLALVAPGLAPYQALAQTVQGNAPVFEGNLYLNAGETQTGLTLQSVAPEASAAAGGAATLSLESLRTIQEAKTASAARIAGGADGRRSGVAMGLRSASEAGRGPIELGRQLQPVESLDIHRPLFDRSKPEAAPAPEAKKQDGAAPVEVEGERFLVVGSNATREFLMSRPSKFVKNHAMKLTVVDEPSRRHLWNGLVDDEHFIAANIDNHDEKNQQSIIEKAAAYAAKHKVQYSYSWLNAQALLAARIGDAIGAVSNSAKAVEAAHTKTVAREVINRRAPTLATPSLELHSAEEAREAFSKIAAPGGMVVLKPIKGGGSQFVEVGIDSAEKAAEVWTAIDKGLRDFMKSDHAGFSQLDQYPGIMMERQLVGAEFDVEIIRDRRGRLVFGHVSDNPPMEPPYAVEKAATYSSQLPDGMQKDLIVAANMALDALADEFGDLVGNFHVEMMWTPDGPKLLEVNARMGGIFVHNMILKRTGASLVEQSMRALKGLAVEFDGSEVRADLRAGYGPDPKVEVRLGIPNVSGVIDSIEGLDEVSSMPGVFEVVRLKKAGDTVKAAPEDFFDYFFYVATVGKDYGEAMDRILAAMAKVTIRIRTKETRPVLRWFKSTRVVAMRGDAQHRKEDPMRIIDEAAQAQKARLEKQDSGKGDQSSGRQADARTQSTGSVQHSGRQDDPTKLPKSFWVYMLGIALYAFAQEAIAGSIAGHASTVGGLEFAVLTQGLSIFFRIPGSFLGAKIAKKLDSRATYVISNVLNGLIFLGIPIAVLAAAPTGTVKGLFIAFSIVAGLAYGATRGVAEQEIMPRIVGQDNKELLSKANSWFFLIVEPAAFIGALLITPLTIFFGDPFKAAIVAGVLLAASAVPFALVKYRQKVLYKLRQSFGTEDKLPLKMYLPYVYFTSVHQLFYGLLAPFFALEILQKAALQGQFVGLYDIGSFAIAFGLTFLPKLMPKLSEKGWALVAMIPVLGFLWGTLLLGAPIVSLGMAALVGVATTIVQIKWKPIYQNRLKIEAQARVFQWLSIAAVGTAFVPFLLFKGSAAIGMTLPLGTMLMGVAVFLTVGAAAVAWAMREPAAATAAEPKAPKKTPGEPDGWGDE